MSNNLTDQIFNQTEANAAKKAPGRPVVEGSARQKKLAEMKARAEANGGIKLGRPPVADSKRQQQLKEKQEKLASGYVPKKGRPSFASLGVLTKKELAKQPTTVVVTPTKVDDTTKITSDVDTEDKVEVIIGDSMPENETANTGTVTTPTAKSSKKNNK
jgi:hypothetical protein